MTDEQIVDIVIKRAIQAWNASHASENTISSAKIALIQQYNKKIYFTVLIESLATIVPLAFSHNRQSMVFLLPELPDKLMEWKRDIIRKCRESNLQYVVFDVRTFPKEIVHIFSSAVISALNTSGMSMNLMTFGHPEVFAADETYEEISIEADLDGFSSN